MNINILLLHQSYFLFISIFFNYNFQYQNYVNIFELFNFNYIIMIAYIICMKSIYDHNIFIIYFLRKYILNFKFLKIFKNLIFIQNLFLD